jgi:hypothetical protein
VLEAIRQLALSSGADPAQAGQEALPYQFVVHATG